MQKAFCQKPFRKPWALKNVCLEESMRLLNISVYGLWSTCSLLAHKSLLWMVLLSFLAVINSRFFPIPILQIDKHPLWCPKPFKCLINSAGMLPSFLLAGLLACVCTTHNLCCSSPEELSLCSPSFA